MTSHWIGDIASAATALGVFLAVAGLRQSRRQRFQEFEDHYVQRYWSIRDQLSFAALSEDRSDPLTEADRKWLRAYVTLSEDEGQVRASGWITDSTWHAWISGIREQLEVWPFAEEWEKVEQQYPAPRFEHVRGCLVDERYDPCPAGWLLRRWRGL